MQLANNPSTKATYRYGTYRYRDLHEGTVPSTYRPTAAISRNAPFQLLQSIAVPQAIKLHPSRETPNDVDVLSRSRRSICYAHVMIAVAARFRLISPIPSLVNRRGNNLHTVDVNTTWYVHREGDREKFLNLNAKKQLPYRCWCDFHSDVLSQQSICPCYFKHSPCTNVPSDTATTCTIVERISSKEPSVLHVTKRSTAWYM